MNILVLKPAQRDCDCAYLADDQAQSLPTDRVRDYRAPASARSELARVSSRMGELSATMGSVDAIGVRAAFGGSAFRGPALVTPQVVAQLHDMIPHAPLHLPAMVRLVETCGEVFAGVPAVLVFETSFFADLPPREHLYALDFDMMQASRMRRYGFHGTFHGAVCAQVARARRQKGVQAAARVVSVCLEPRPEVAAAIGMRPLMVTSGSTPLEGLPGETTCGEIDPSIVIMLEEKMGWGPEQINTVLTQESGLSGLTAQPTDLRTVFTREDDEGILLAHKIIQYRILQACGAGIAAMGGLDTIVFSGRFVDVGEILGPWLTSHLPFLREREDHRVAWECFREPIDRLVAEAAAAVVIAVTAPVGKDG